MQTQTISTGYVPHEYQQQVHEGLRRFSVVVCHRRFGKTYLAVNQLIHSALTHSGTPQTGQFAYVAPFRNQAKRITWGYFKQFLREIPGVKFNESDLVIDFANGSRIMLFGADNADAMRGIYLNGVVCDEVGDYKPDVYQQVIRPTLMDYKGWCLFIGTPKGLNQFSELYFKACDPNNKDWFAAMFRGDETGLLDDEELKAMRDELSSNAYRQEILCDFTATSDDVLITIDMVERAKQKSFSETDLFGTAKVIGVDVARFGDDKSVIMRRHGQAVLEPIVFEKIDNMQLAARVAHEIKEFKPDAVMIDGGRGEGVIDRLRQLNFDVNEVNFGSSPLNPRYKNKRAEMWDNLANFLKDGGGLPKSSRLGADLIVPTYHFDSANRMALESKDHIKERGMPSPDLADALALTFAYPVSPRNNPLQTYAQATVQTGIMNNFMENL